MTAVAQTLEEYGGNPADILRFVDDDPALLPYATLIGPQGSGATTGNVDLAPLHGVYEWQGSPLIFLVDGASLRNDQHLRSIRRILALRGDAPYLGVIEAGRLAIHRLSLDQVTPAASKLDLGTDRITVFSQLANNRPGIAKRTWITNVILRLLGDTIDSLVKLGVGSEQAISLVGRALFIRFLADRHLLSGQYFPDGERERVLLLDNRASAEHTSRWLDQNFNGDFLPLDPDIFERLPADAYRTLGNIMRRADAGGQLYLGWEERWDFLDFAHIPVGVLSQAYEQYLREHAPEKQRREGGYYTPRHIAELMVQGAFHGLRKDGRAHLARVLDPAAGAGIFLISVFRQLVAERWAHDGKRPDTRVLREILYTQLVGFDVNEGALRFAALGLYLMAIELDPQPEPVEKLRFPGNLRGRVLVRIAGDSNGGDAGVASDSLRSPGSLGPTVGDEHIGQYDLVIGNPPWVTGTKLPGYSEVRKIVARIAAERLSEGAGEPPLPNECMDLPFVWRAMEWAREGGRIAFALHGRLLFQQGDGMLEARRAIFQAIDPTSVLNGADLLETQVWPKIRAPFCLLFAINRQPLLNSAFRYVSPHLEIELNDAGKIRVDATHAELVSNQQIQKKRTVFKELFRGNMLDIEIIEKLDAPSQITLATYWKNLFGTLKGNPRQSGNGYQKLRKSSRIRKTRMDNQPGTSANYLLNLPELSSTEFKGLLVNFQALKSFQQMRIHDPRPRDLFKGPLLIVHQSPTVASNRVRVLITDSDLVFNESYYGYSVAGHPEAHQLVRYLALLIGSKPILWFLLLTSGKFGVERSVLEKQTIDNIPVIPLERITSDAREQIVPLFDAIVREDTEKNWQRVDAWIASLYGLHQRDLQVISDTLRCSLPFAENRRCAQQPPTAAEITHFCAALKTELHPWAHRSEISLTVREIPLPKSSPWGLIRIAPDDATAPPSPTTPDHWPEVLRLADDMGTTELIFPDETTGELLIGRLRQARYWSHSQARLLARRIVWEHLDTLLGTVSA